MHLIYDVIHSFQVQRDYDSVLHYNKQVIESGLETGLSGNDGEFV